MKATASVSSSTDESKYKEFFALLQTKSKAKDHSKQISAIQDFLHEHFTDEKGHCYFDWSFKYLKKWGGGMMKEGLTALLMAIDLRMWDVASWMLQQQIKVGNISVDQYTDYVGE